MNYTDAILNSVLANDTVGALSKKSGAKKSQVESLIGAGAALDARGHAAKREHEKRRAGADAGADGSCGK